MQTMKLSSDRVQLIDHSVILLLLLLPLLLLLLLQVGDSEFNGWHIPLVYGLLHGKTEVLYTSMFSYLDTCGPYGPQSVLCDYEQALHNAVVSTWPGVTPRGCYFHYSQDDVCSTLCSRGPHTNRMETPKTSHPIRHVNFC